MYENDFNKFDLVQIQFRFMGFFTTLLGAIWHYIILAWDL